MVKRSTFHLFDLIKSLTTAEKRYFSQQHKLQTGEKQLLFYQLFLVLDKMKEYNEATIFKKIPQMKKSQLSNVKGNLYQQLLKSLRSTHLQHNPDIEIREMIDFARILYTKGFYRAALDQLERAKKKAQQTRLQGLVIEIIEFEKHIESQHITRSIRNKAQELSTEAEHWSEKLQNTQQLSNLTLRLYGQYLQRGYVRNEMDYHLMQEQFKTKFPKKEQLLGSFYERLYWYQAHIWYHYINQNFKFCYKYAYQWVDLFETDYPEMINVNTSLYLKGIHYLLNSLFQVWHYEKFREILERLEQFKPKQSNKNIDALLFLYRYHHRINRCFIEGDFSTGTKIVPELVKEIELDTYRLDRHRIMLFYYKIACIYYGAGAVETSIDYLNKIINRENPNFREDIQCFARLLNLMAHYDLGNAELLPYQVKSLYRFLRKMKDIQKVQSVILRFIRRLPKIQPAELKEHFIELKETLEIIKKERYQVRPFLYLDLISWLESKIEGTSVQEVMQRKFQTQFITQK